MQAASYATYQNEIYARGATGELPPFTTDLDALESSAKQQLGPGPFGYLAGPAGTGMTMRANRAAFDRWRIVPRMLTKSTSRYLETSVLGTAMPAPVLAGPVGVQSIVHPDGELATARACAELGLTMVLSMMSCHSIEDVAEANAAGSRWFQLYWPNDDDITVSLLQRAHRSGFSVLVVTLDTMSLGWRPAVLDRAYLPMLRGIGGTAILFSDPVFRARLAKPPEEDLAAALEKWGELLVTAGRSWDEIGFLRKNWPGPIVLKGILHPDDARRAVACGMDGIVVSNHGGRQLDGAVAALDMLPDITDAVGDDITVLFDSGIRTGSDVLKALAIGARAVLIGRPYVYGLAHAGQLGVRHVLRSLLADFELTMGLAGYRSLAELSRAALHDGRTPVAAGSPGRTA